MALLDEQENRVRIPNGTAAVCAKTHSLDESQSLGRPGKAECVVKSSHLEGMSQKTYAAFFLLSRGIRERPLSQKNGCGAYIAPQPILF